MTDIFTDGQFVELPSVSIDVDCSQWFPVFEACLRYAYDRDLIAGDPATVEALTEEALNWLIDNDCVQP